MSELAKLTGPKVLPASGGPARQLVVLLHGVGADGVLPKAGLRLPLRIGDAFVAGRIDHRPGPLTAENLRDTLGRRNVELPA